MKKLILKMSLVLCFITTHGWAQNLNKTFEMEGLFNSKNILIKNSYGKGGIGYCVSEVRVNGKVTRDEINADLFQIDLSTYGLKNGDKVKIEITYKDSCTPGIKPLVINPGALITMKGLSGQNCSFMIEVKYLYQNVFVINPGGKGIKDIKINSLSSTQKFDKEIVEIKLNNMNFKEGEKIKLEIVYAPGADPLIINPDVLSAQ